MGRRCFDHSVTSVSGFDQGESFVICIRVPRLHAYSAVPNCPRVAGATPEDYLDYSRASLPITVVRIEQRTKSSGLEVRNNASIKVVRV